MAVHGSQLEGTWEDIVAHGDVLAGRRVRVTVLPAGRASRRDAGVSTNKRLLRAIAEAEHIQRDMTPSGAGAESVATVREARGGAMFGDDCGS